jgi:hypothetical protein
MLGLWGTSVGREWSYIMNAIDVEVPLRAASEIKSAALRDSISANPLTLLLAMMERTALKPAAPHAPEAESAIRRVRYAYD